MEIVAVDIYNAHYPFVNPIPSGRTHGTIDGFDAVLVKLTSSDGAVGWGEMAPLGAFYSEAFPSGARAGVVELAPTLLGKNPAQVLLNRRLLDMTFKGHSYIKSSIDMAMCDLAARSQGVPLSDWLGGTYGQTVDVYGVLMNAQPTKMAEQAAQMIKSGAKRLQLKVGGLSAMQAADSLQAVTDVVPQGTVIYCDANAQWTTMEAVRFARFTEAFDFIFEQPCASIQDCASVRSASSRSIVLDESITSIHALLEAHNQCAVDGITIKISRVGGVTKAAHMRDLAVDLGLKISIEDTGGGAINNSAMTHLSLSTPEEHRMHSSSWAHWLAAPESVGLTPGSGYELLLQGGTGLGIQDYEHFLNESPLLLSLHR